MVSEGDGTELSRSWTRQGRDALGQALIRSRCRSRSESQPVAPGWPTSQGNDTTVSQGVGQATRGRRLSQRHVQRPEHQLGVKMVGHGPPHDPAAKHVEHDGQAHEPRPGRHVGHVGHPKPIRRIAWNWRSTRSGTARWLWSTARVGMDHREKEGDPFSNLVPNPKKKDLLSTSTKSEPSLNGIPGTKEPAGRNVAWNMILEHRAYGSFAPKKQLPRAITASFPHSLLDTGDKTGARMAFIEAYAKNVLKYPE